jgi:antitoxin (DNA-binding transcriptional repressor) of toxin-antitoxin stability system
MTSPRCALASRAPPANQSVILDDAATSRTIAKHAKRRHQGPEGPSEHVRAAAAGETALVTDRGQVVAELVSPGAGTDASPAEQRLGELMRQGMVALAKLPARTRLPRHWQVTGITELLRQPDESRQGRRSVSALRSCRHTVSPAVRTLHALHLATMALLRSQGLTLALATCDRRLPAAAVGAGSALADCRPPGRWQRAPSGTGLVCCVAAAVGMARQNRPAAPHVHR